ncbi:putative nuclease HARBI1 [Prorops nasuta]|uniref:putative nuclease HARBI1 n=1 Tax=Prorops nasuta TaxID=863751 RepID=UPI0034CD5C36
MCAVKFIFLNELLESSSSDEEDENVFIKYGIRDKRPKITEYLNVVNKYSDNEFQRNFRLQRNTYNKLKNLYEKSHFCQNLCNERAIPNDGKLLSFLWFAGNKCSIRDVASRFNMAESTFHLVCNNIMEFLNNLAKSIIKFPETIEEKTEISNEFKTINNFPGILGCIDGTYITIRTPAHKIKSTYVNRHDIPSLTLQAICDAKKMFLDVFTGPPSKIHDARIFKLSFISSILPDICGNEWHILGDAAYPIKKYLITPYRDYGNLTEEQRNFNYKFSACRVKIENAFGLLKGRFRQLLRLDFHTVYRSCKFIIACCALHNLCIFNEDNLDDLLEEIEEPFQNFENICEENHGNNDKALGEEKRNFLCHMLNEI